MSDSPFRGSGRDSLRQAADEILRAGRARDRQAAREGAGPRDGRDADPAAGADETAAMDADTGWDGQDAAGEAPSDPAPDMAGMLDRLEAEKAELRDQALRLAAEMENLRKRTARDVQDARTYGVTNFARDMLAVADNLRRGLEAVTPEARAAGGEAMTTLLEGVELTERSMLAALERHGVRPVEAQGQKFDANVHQAMFEVPDASVPHGTVVQVMQPGYVIGERVLRPAMVGVARGGPRPGAESAAPAATAEPDADA